MANLLIKNAYGTWRLIVTNSPVEYSFAGATPEAQYEQIQALQDAMVEGPNAVTQQIGQIVRGIQPGDEGTVVRQLFGDSQKLFYNEDIVYATVGEDSSLFAEMVDAGEALAAFA